MDFLQLPTRTKKERSFGITSIIDLGISIGELKNILNDYHSFIDFAKIGVGSAYITPNLKEKVLLYKDYGIKPFCGGTLFEKCYSQNKMQAYVSFLHEYGFEWLEISSGTINISLNTRLQLLSELKKNFHIIVEVGSKDGDKEFPLSIWKEEMSAFINGGCDYIMTEGRESGTCGIYEKSGEIKSNLISELIKDFDYKKIIFEAPSKKHQMYFIKELGANVNLGNVNIHDVLVVESQRCGLRSETFFLEEKGCKLLLSDI